MSSADGQRFLVDSVTQEATITGVVCSWMAGLTNKNARGR